MRNYPTRSITVIAVLCAVVALYFLQQNNARRLVENEPSHEEDMSTTISAPPDDLPIPPIEDSSQHLGIQRHEPPPLSLVSPQPQHDDAAEEEEPADSTVSPKPKEKSLYLGAASHRRMVPKDGGLVIGGWTTPNGDRVFALTTPVERGKADDAVIEIKSTLFSIAADSIKDDDLQRLVLNYDDGQNDSGLVYDARTLKTLLTTTASDFNRVFSSPTISTTAGEYASIQIEDGENGTMLAVIASHGDNDGEIDLGVSVADYGEDLTDQE